jgi:hypothetical protein
MPGKTRKRPLSEWNKFVMSVKKQNPKLTFKNVLKLASKLKKKGKNGMEYVANTTKKVGKKIKKALVNKKKRTKKTRKN